MPTVRKATPAEVAAWTGADAADDAAVLRAALERLDATYQAAVRRIVELERGAKGALACLEEGSQANTEHFRKAARARLREALQLPPPARLRPQAEPERWWCPYCQSDAFARDVRQPDRCLRCARRIGAHGVRW